MALNWYQSQNSVKFHANTSNSFMVYSYQLKKKKKHKTANHSINVYVKQETSIDDHINPKL